MSPSGTRHSGKPWAGLHSDLARPPSLMELLQVPVSESPALEPRIFLLGFQQPTGHLEAVAITASAELGFFAGCSFSSAPALPAILRPLTEDLVFPSQELIHLRRPERLQGTISPSSSGSQTPMLPHCSVHTWKTDHGGASPGQGCLSAWGRKAMSVSLPPYSLDGDSVPCILFSFRWNFCS